MYLKYYFLYTLILFSLSVGPTGPNQKAYFGKFSIPVNFVVLRKIRWILTDPDPQHWLNFVGAPEIFV
jgi:hypothetical protein